MADLAARIAAEKANVERTLADLDVAMGREDLGVVEMAAIGAVLHNIYSGIENIVKQVLKSKGRPIPAGATWRRDLLEAAVSASVLDQSLVDGLYAGEVNRFLRNSRAPNGFAPIRGVKRS